MTQRTLQTGLEALWAPELDPLFWSEHRPEWLGAWYAHIPFAFWMASAAVPGTLVELGTHYGTSFFSFCEAVAKRQLATRCYAVDTWLGDPQAGFYGEAVYESVRAHLDTRYASFAELLRCTFDEALSFFAEGSIDLLHIDGLHTYDAVRSDFEHWQPKLSDRGVVLLHDTNVRQGDFGVWRLWAELRQRFPAFEFLHGHGLGVLAVGADVPDAVAALCALTEPCKVHAVRNRFALLGERFEFSHRLARATERLKTLEAADAQGVPAAERDALLAERDALLAARDALLAERDALLAAQATLSGERDALLAAQATLSGERDAALAERDAIHARVSEVQNESDARTTALTAQLAERDALVLAANQLRTRAAERARVARAETAVVAARAVGSVLAASRKSATHVVFVSGEPDTPGHMYRVARYARAAEHAGADSVCVSIADAARASALAKNADLVIVWRAPWEPRLMSVVESARAAGAKVVFDIDDLLVDPNLAKIDVVDGIRSQGLTEAQMKKHFSDWQAAMLAADCCTAPTEELAAYLRRFGRPTWVLPNGFDAETIGRSRRAVEARARQGADGYLRIGYAGGSRTHQRDFAAAAEAVARVLRARKHARLVLFRRADIDWPVLDLEEFGLFEGLEDQIEWRHLVPLRDLPDELARFDINLAPLETGNIFCESKSELKYFEAALVDVPTVASPTGPYRRAIRHAETGFLANNPDDWHEALIALADDPALRYRMARTAQREVLWTFGPLRRGELMAATLPQMLGSGWAAARGFASQLTVPTPVPVSHERIADLATEAESTHLKNEDELTVVLAPTLPPSAILPAVHALKRQSLAGLSLFVLDPEKEVVEAGLRDGCFDECGERFHRVAVLKAGSPADFAASLNAAFDRAETPSVFLVDQALQLHPECLAGCLGAMQTRGAAFVAVREAVADADTTQSHVTAFVPARLVGGLVWLGAALIDKAAWVAVGGFRQTGDPLTIIPDFWLRLAERGLPGWEFGEATSSLDASHPVQRPAPVNAPLREFHPWLGDDFLNAAGMPMALSAGAKPAGRSERPSSLR